jgi:copper chaperone CopZ
MFSKAECITMQLSGVCDAATRKAAAQAIKHVNGVRSVAIDRQNAVAQVTFLPEKTTVPAITDALEQAGFFVI